jgi:hypothetical protein
VSNFPGGKRYSNYISTLVLYPSKGFCPRGLRSMLKDKSFRFQVAGTKFLESGMNIKIPKLTIQNKAILVKMILVINKIIHTIELLKYQL